MLSKTAALAEQQRSLPTEFGIQKPGRAACRILLPAKLSGVGFT